MPSDADPADGVTTPPNGSATAASSTSTDEPGRPSGAGATPSAERPTLVGAPSHLHPLSIPYRVLQQGVGIAVALAFAGVPIFTTLSGLLGTAAAVGLVVVVAGAIVGYVVAYYRRFEYELTPDTFDIRSGVLSRREREIPLRRVQNVDISQNVVQRALGIAQVNLETAGGSDTEAQLRFVGEDRATEIQRGVSRLNRSEEGGDEPESERFDTVFEITDRELAVLATVSTDFRVASIVFLGASIFAPSAASAMNPETYIGPETILRAVLGPLAGLALVVFFGLLSGVFNATRYYGFQLHRATEELRYERGLVQKFSGTIPLGKVQSLTIRENVLARALGYASLYIETAGQGGGAQQGSSQSAVPLAERGRVHDLATSIEDYGDLSFRRPPKRARERYAVRYAIVFVVLAGLLYAAGWVVDFRLYWYVPLAGLLLTPVAAHLKWKHRGYHVGEDHVVTRNGFWVRQTKVVPYHRVQTVFSTETVFQRRRHIGTVTVDTAGSRSLAGNDARAVDVATDTVDELRERVSEELSAALRRRQRDASRRRRSTGPTERGRGSTTEPGSGSGTPGD